MSGALRALLVLWGALLTGSFKFLNTRHTTSPSKSRLFDEAPQAPESYERNKDGSFSNKSDVKDTLSKLFAVLGPLAPSKIDEGVVSQEKLIQDVQDGFSKILLGVRESSMTPMEKRMIITEANMILSDMKTKEGVENIASNTYGKKNSRINTTPPNTLLFSEKSSPYLLVYGSGIMGQETLKKMKKVGKLIEMKVVDGDFLGVMSEKEIEFAVRNVKTIIIVADSKKIESKGGWFGGGKAKEAVPTKDEIGPININNEEWDQLLNEKSLKKLLNATMKECNKNSQNIKVISVGKATTQSKSLTSFLGGENTEFDSEVILQCKQRGLGYAVVKVGTLINNDVPLPPNTKNRATAKALKLSPEESEVAQKEYISPVQFTSSRVELSEVTRISLAVDAVLRSAAHPLMNSTTTVLSSYSSVGVELPTDKQWDDEFLRLDGPELERIPLRFSSVNQAVLRLGLIIEALKAPGGGMVTPIEVERFENGVRVIFKPLKSSYESKNDERKIELKNDKDVKIISKDPKILKSTGYLSPEQEKIQEEKEEREKNKALQEEKIKLEAPKKSNQSVKPEGGLEIIVENEPYRRVRVRRCNMGPQTIVKGESEAVLMKAIFRGLESLENDYRVALMTSFKV